MQNNQKALRKDLDASGKLHVHSIFDTIQGEGPFAGTPAVFIRLFGCNLQCPTCDTDYTSNNDLMTPESVLEKLGDSALNPYMRRKLVVLTGGEPLRQNIVPLAALLIENGFTVQVETNGTMPVGPMDDRQTEYVTCNPFFVLVCSPKTPRVNLQISNLCRHWKYVVRHDNYDAATGIPLQALGGMQPYNIVLAKSRDKVVKVYMQPEDAQDSKINYANTETAVAICREFGYIFCLQVHKYINVP